MNEVIEIIFGDSTYFTMSKSKLNMNKIIKFNTLFSIGDISNISNDSICVPKEIFKENFYDFSKEMRLLDSFIKNNKKIRIWTSRNDSDSYILLTYLCNYLKDVNCNLYVVYVDDYDINCQSPSILREEQLEEAVKYEKKLLLQDIKELANIWVYIKNNKADMRLMINKKVELVSYNYFNDIILNKLKELGRVKESRLVANLLIEYHIVDSIFVYLIDRLINKDKIKVVKKSESGRKFDNIIELN